MRGIVRRAPPVHVTSPAVYVVYTWSLRERGQLHKCREKVWIHIQKLILGELIQTTLLGTCLMSGCGGSRSVERGGIILHVQQASYLSTNNTHITYIVLLSGEWYDVTNVNALTIILFLLARDAFRLLYFLYRVLSVFALLYDIPASTIFGYSRALNYECRV